jgi:uncharacterized protein YfaS (alpha-2-macroglobulin family)
VRTPLSFVILALAAIMPPATGRTQDVDYARLETEAEKLHAEGSYARARELYLKADALNLPPEKARWVDFRLADTLWRSQAGTRTADPSVYDKALEGLNILIRDVKPADRDRLWAEVQESLGDFHWTRPDSRNWHGGWEHYRQALDWWAGSKDIEEARERYLEIVWRASSPPWRERHYYYGYHGNMIPLEVLENALEITASPEGKARARFLIAMTLRHQAGDPYSRMRVRREFEAALEPGKSTEWYDDALYHLAEWLQNAGRIVTLEDGQVRVEPDFPAALELHRRLVREHEKGETRYHDGSTNWIAQITKPVLDVGVHHAFAPGSEVEYHLSWRNVKRIDLVLFRVDLTRDVDLSGDSKSAAAWVQAVSLAGAERTRSWTRETGDRGDYMPGSAVATIDGKLEPGAYILEATAEGLKAREAVLVTDAALVLKTSGRQALVWFAAAGDGEPIAKARVLLWERTNDGSRWRWRPTLKDTDADGLALFDLLGSANHAEVYAAAILGDRQAFATGGNWWRRRGASWKIYAFTDRPAYRPGEKVEWKVMARTHDGSVHATPAGRRIEYEVLDPRGTKASEGKLSLNEFGSAWGSLDLTASMPLGEYSVRFWEDGRKNAIGGATLFRLEEYKLPEFKVSIRTPEEGGKKKAFRLGERVEATISAEYYFGGAVADAQVEVLVHQSPFYHFWRPERDYPWLYDEMSHQRRFRGGGQVVKREVLRTDSRGEVAVSFDTPAGSGQDFEYRIEARVTDASRREIRGSQSVRVTRQRYYVHPRAEHNIYKPGDRVKVLFKALDANEVPVEVEGKVKVTRERWTEVWLTPDGKEVRGDELEAARSRERPFPPAGWRLKFRGYEREEITTATVKTDREGNAELSFNAAREGYYRIAWTSEDEGSAPIRAETYVWVATGETAELGWRHGGVEIIADRDTFRAGEKTPVLLSTSVPGRRVLFSVEGEDLYDYRVVHVTGTAKLVELAVEEKHVPNVFLGAVMLSDREAHLDSEEVVVPPVKNFLTVDVKPDRADYLPREEGTLTVTALDHEGKPVAAEVALSLVDESVYYIQGEYAGDPRQFFFGSKRELRVGTESTPGQKPFAKPRADDRVALGDDFRFEEEKEFQVAESLEALGDSARGQRGMTLARRRAAGRAGAMPEPAAAAPMALSEAKLSADAADAEGGEEAPVQVRTDFRSTVVWEPGIVTGPDGKATVKVRFPDSLTSWRASSRAATRGSQFGTASSTVRTRMPLIVRLQAPRFFVAGDSAVVSAVINNNTEKPMEVAATLAADGVKLAGYLRDGSAVEGNPGPVTVAAGGEARVDWVVNAVAAGEARLKATARGQGHADAMEKTYPVYEHGIERFIARSGKMRGEGVTVKIDLPRERKPESTTLVVQAAPSLAVTMLDALPYLADYPYGCTEQTMSRFLPAAIVAKTLKDLGLSADAVAGKLFGGIEPEHTAKTQPRGKKDLAKLDEMAQAGLSRLHDFQHGDGGWGWWKEGESDHFMTAYVVWGLALARGANLDVRPEAAERGAEFLEKEIVEEETHPDMQAWMLHAIAAHHAAARKTEVGKFTAKAVENLWRSRDQLNAYTRALFALAAHHLGDAEKARTLARNLENGVKRDEAPDTSIVLDGPRAPGEGVMATAHWGEDGIYWRWSDGGVEATAFALRALLAIDPESKLIEPAMNWLVKGRRGAQWSNTRDTAIAVLSLNEYLRRSGELAPEVEYEVLVNGRSVAARKVAAADALTAPSRFAVAREHLRDGVNEVRIARKGGRSPIYFGVEAAFFSLEEPIPAAGNEIFVRRDYERIALKRTLLKGFVPEREPLPDAGRVLSGERVEVVLTIEAKNNYEYLVFEDMKPAGLEAVEVRSGGGIHARELRADAAPPGSPPAAAADPARYTGRSRWVYQELRDRKVALFIDKLPEGLWEIRYELRAETPGRFHGLPLLAHAMYVPEIRANGTEMRLEVKDAPPEPRQMRRAVVGSE